ncbi:MAG: DUF4824 family protein [Candidatus Solibacter sp.]|nr:DUF4824 family protein [Candidatus Solibacter sp.]
MKRKGVLLAVAVVLVSDAIALLEAARNRAGEPVESIQLTERELRLVRPTKESTALLLQLDWKPVWRWVRAEEGAEFFEKAKLEELGFDCRLPVTDPSAAAHYRATVPRQVFAVLEYRESTGEESRSRLQVVDAGRDFARLRGKYGGQGRYLIVPGLVRLHFENGGRLQGGLVELCVGEISVPPQERGAFEDFAQTSAEYFATPVGKTKGPRYTAVLYYGKNLEPWVASCQPR